MDSAKALEMDYLLCDVLKITMDTLDTIPLHIVTKMREVAARDIYEEELLMEIEDSISWLTKRDEWEILKEGSSLEDLQLTIRKFLERE